MLKTDNKICVRVGEQKANWKKKIVDHQNFDLFYEMRFAQMKNEQHQLF